MTDSPPANREYSGKWVVLLLVGTGVVGVLAAIGYRHWLQKPLLELWGSQHAKLIIHAPQVFALELSSTTNSSVDRQEIKLGDQLFHVTQSKEVTQEPGTLNIRQGLMSRATYNWNIEPDSLNTPRWTHALRFVDPSTEENPSTTILFDKRGEWVALSPSGSAICCRPVANALEDYFQKVFPTENQTFSPTNP